MTAKDTCPNCGAELAYDGYMPWLYECGTLIHTGERLRANCYISQIEQQAAEIARLGTALTHIAEHGGTTDEESGLSHNGSWCAEQARCALEKVK